MEIYYKVHKNDIPFFPNIKQYYVDVFINVCNGGYKGYFRYKPKKYIYIITYDDDPISFMPYLKTSITYFNRSKYCNGGEFKSEKTIRKEKLKKLKKLNERR